MKYTQVPKDLFKKLILNAGVIVSNFEPSSGSLEAEDILGATDGGVSFSATPTYGDYADGIDNMTTNTKETKYLQSVEAKMSGTYKTVTDKLIKDLAASADISGENLKKITPRSNLTDDDFKDIWWVGDYSDVNEGEENGKANQVAGFLAIHLMNALNTNGFNVNSANKDKGSIPFEYLGHYSIETPDVIPYEVYLRQGSEEASDPS